MAPLDNPLAAVTGASSGIGATFARQLAAQGYQLLLIARRAERLEELAAELRAKHGAPAGIIAADLTRDEDVEGVARRLESAGNLALLVNNAGFGTRGLFFEADAAQQEAMHRLHILATVRLTRAALPGMVARGRGAVINVSSVAGFLQAAGNVSYCATKAWMNSFTEGLGADLKRAGSPVIVQALCPGYTYSEFHDVMGVDRGSIPRSWWTPAEFVVRESLLGLERGDLFVIPGWRYRAMLKGLKFVPRQLMLWGAEKLRPRGT